MVLVYTAVPVCLYGVDKQLQWALYYDSNPFESVQPADESMGITVRGRWRHQLAAGKFSGNIVLAGQAFHDQLHRSESKYILNPSLHIDCPIAPGLSAAADLVLFKKEYLASIGAYQRTDLNIALVYNPARRFTLWLSRRRAQKVLKIIRRYRYTVANTNIKARYQFTDRYFAEADFDQINIVHLDVPVLDDSAENSGNRRADHGYRVSLHVRYSGHIITGLKYGQERIQSNTLAGYYDSTLLNFYLSTNITPKSFAHLSLRRIYKRYRHEQFPEASYYLDPEEPLQNLAHLRLEYQADKSRFYYLQISLLQNETTINRVYYSKALFEIGSKYNF